MFLLGSSGQDCLCTVRHERGRQAGLQGVLWVHQEEGGGTKESKELRILFNPFYRFIYIIMLLLLNVFFEEPVIEIRSLFPLLFCIRKSGNLFSLLCCKIRGRKSRDDQVRGKISMCTQKSSKSDSTSIIVGFHMKITI